MKRWLGIGFLLAAAIAAALAWQLVADDPGSVVVRLRGWSLETSVVVAIIGLVLIWAILSVLFRLLRWPLQAWTHGQRRRGRERLAGGLTALAEGRYSQAERSLNAAAQREETRASALLALADAAHSRGADDHARDVLIQAESIAPAAAQTVRARHLLKNGDPVQALAVLKVAREKNELTPLGSRLMIEAALQSNDAETALAALEPLRRSQAFSSVKVDALAERVYIAVIAAAKSIDSLNSTWKSLSKEQRRDPDLIAAYAQRSVVLQSPMAAVDMIETAQRAGWSEKLAAAYGELGLVELEARKRTAEGWLKVAPNSPALLLTLARLHLAAGQRSRAREDLDRALAAAETSPAWELYGDVAGADGDTLSAAIAYANALRVQRGEATQPLPKAVTRSVVDTQAMLVDQRDQHGLPLLPR
ncbi:MAG: heme biosynthesis HemY N-terminal domain-containing protein [Dokdonella sp.]